MQQQVVLDMVPQQVVDMVVEEVELLASQSRLCCASSTARQGTVREEKLVSLLMACRSCIITGLGR